LLLRRLRDDPRRKRLKMPRSRKYREGIACLKLAAQTLAAALILVFGSAPATLAQKSADTLRIPFADPIATTSLYFDSKNETSLTSMSAFDTLVCFDPRQNAFEPLLAKSWRQIDDRTLEFTLRKDVKFHDGTPFTSADVVATLNWIVDPASKLRFAPINFPWLARAEAVDAYTVRITAKEPTPLALITLAVHGEILSAKLLAASDDKAELMRKNPVGTGPYKITAFDSSTGIKLVKNPDFHSLNDCKHEAQIGKIVITPMPEQQTQIEALTIGQVDLAFIGGKDEVEFLGASPGLAATPVEDSFLQFLAIDSINRSGVAPLANPAVRRAIAAALNRLAIARAVMPGGATVHEADALCSRLQIGCDYSTKPPAYDPEAAKRLLADAGFAGGFDVGIVAMPGSWEMADALAGELRKIGIRASVERATQGTMRRKQADGQIALWAGFWPPVYHLDASSIVSYLFDDTPRNYWRDPELQRLGEEGLRTVDPAKRQALYRQLFDRVNEQAYVVPLAITPSMIVHNADLVVDGKPPHPIGPMLYDFRWK